MTFSVILGPPYVLPLAWGGEGYFFFSLSEKGENVRGWVRNWGRFLLCGLLALGVPVLL